MTNTVPFSDATRAALQNPYFLAGLRALMHDAARAAAHSYDLIRIPLEAAGLSMTEARLLLERPLGRKVSSMILLGRKPGMQGGVQGGEAGQDPAEQASSRANFPKLSKSAQKRAKRESSTKKTPLKNTPTYRCFKKDKTLHVPPSESEAPITPESGAEGGGERLHELRTVPPECAQSIMTLAEQAGVEPEVALLSVTRWHNRPAWVMAQLSALVQIRTVQTVTSPTGMFLTAAKGGRPLELPRSVEKAVPAAVIYPEEALALVGLELLHDGEPQRVIGLRARDYAALERLDSPGAITLVPWRALLPHSAGHVGASNEREAPKEKERSPLSGPGGGTGSTALEVAAALLGRAEGAAAAFVAQHLERHKLRGASTCLAVSLT